MDKSFHKTGTSIFTKLSFFIALGILITWFATSALIFLFFTSPDTNNIVKKNLNVYLDYIVKDIGIPPDTLKARSVSEKTGIAIVYECPEFKWSSSKKFSTIQEMEKVAKLWTLTEYDKNLLLRTFKDGSHTMAIFAKPERVKFPFQYLFLLLIIILSVFILFYFIVRRMLMPLEWLNEGAQKISDEKLDIQIPIRNNDEIGNFTRSFNSMTKRIRDMIRSREQLLGDVSHELRSPLTRLQVALEFVPDGKIKTSMKEDIAEMEKMIEELLESERLNSKYGELNLKNIEISKLVADVVLAYQNRTPGISLKSISDTSVAEIDSQRMKTVIRNLIDNGLKYSKPDGKPVEISVEHDESHIIIRIKDYGIGIPEAEIPFIFEPFYRVDKSRSKKTGGYGLGMSLCKKIVEAHRGKISIASKVNEETTIEIAIPKAI